MEFRSDPDGYVHNANNRVVRREDGTRTEIQSTAGIDVWSMDALLGNGFGTYGAVIARMTFDSHLRPVETVFEGSVQEELSRVQYTCDERGDVVEAVQYCGPGLRAALAAKAGIFEDALPHELAPSGSEQARVTLQYDDAGRVTEQALWFVGQRRIIGYYDQ